jgi:hypothetical protein
MGKDPEALYLPQPFAPFNHILPAPNQITLKSHPDSAFATPIPAQKSRIEVLD